MALELKQTRLDAHLACLEDLYFDGNMPRARYLHRREGLQTELKEIKSKLAARPRAVPLDMNRLFQLPGELDGAKPDDGEWREIVTDSVERIVVRDGSFTVSRREEYRALVTG